MKRRIISIAAILICAVILICFDMSAGLNLGDAGLCLGIAGLIGLIFTIFRKASGNRR